MAYKTNEKDMELLSNDVLDGTMDVDNLPKPEQAALNSNWASAGNDFGNKDGRTGQTFGIETVPGWDPRAGLQTDHLSYGNGRPQPTRYDIEIANNAFGCDLCQEACPWNRAPLPPHPSFLARDEYRATPITDLLHFTQSDFSTLFRKSAIKRAKLAGMQRNVRALTEEADRGKVKG